MSHGKAEALGHYETALGDFRRLEVIAQRLNRVTADDVARVLRAYLVPARRTIVIAEPEPDDGDDADEDDDDDDRVTRVVIEPSPDTPLVVRRRDPRRSGRRSRRSRRSAPPHRAARATRGRGARSRRAR